MRGGFGNKSSYIGFGKKIKECNLFGCILDKDMIGFYFYEKDIEEYYVFLMDKEMKIVDVKMRELIFGILIDLNYGVKFNLSFFGNDVKIMDFSDVLYFFDCYVGDCDNCKFVINRFIL